MSNSTLQEAWNLFYSNSDDIDTSYEKSVVYTAPSKTGFQSPVIPPSSRRSSTVSVNMSYSPSLSRTTTQGSQNLVQELQNLRMQLNNLQYTYTPGSPEYKSAVSVLNGKVDTLLRTINNTDSSDCSSSKDDEGSSPTGSSSPFSKNGDSGKIYTCEKSCCGGRQFSNKSNLVRHQREQSGAAAKLRCSFCDAKFSRSSARNAHEAERKCRP